MYHRRRVADLKSEIAQVQYTAEPVSPPGKLSISLFLIVKIKNFIKLKIYLYNRRRI